MVQSLTFWLTVLAAVPLYWVLPAAFRSAFLAACSLGFLAFAAPASLAVLAAFAVACFAAFHFVRAPRWRWPTAIVLTAGMIVSLALCKAGLCPGVLTGANELVPLGMSYYVFRLIHYAVERARGRFDDIGVSDYAAFILFFPVFSAGPIERLDHFLQNRDTAWSGDQLAAGLTRIAVGLIKQFVVVNLLLAAVVAPVQLPQRILTQVPDLTPWQAWIFSYVQLLSVYISFSAYTDIALGVSRLFGIRIAENFNRPMLAHNVSEFWRRWHMTLVGFVQTYVYMPLIGRTRNPYVATAVTFLVIGVWHGFTLNWVLWGLYNAAGLMVHAAWARRRPKRVVTGWTAGRAAGVLATQVFATLGFVLVYTDKIGLSGAAAVFARMFGVG